MNELHTPEPASKHVQNGGNSNAGSKAVIVDDPHGEPPHGHARDEEHDREKIKSKGV